MYILFDKEGRLVTSLQHGEVVRQGDEINLYIWVEEEFFKDKIIDNYMPKIWLIYPDKGMALRKDGSMSAPVVITQDEGNAVYKKFTPLDKENYGEFKLDKGYYVYHFNLPSVHTTYSGLLKCVIAMSEYTSTTTTTHLESEKYYGNVEIYVEPTYGFSKKPILDPTKLTDGEAILSQLSNAIAYLNTKIGNVNNSKVSKAGDSNNDVFHIGNDTTYIEIINNSTAQEYTMRFYINSTLMDQIVVNAEHQYRILQDETRGSILTKQIVIKTELENATQAVLNEIYGKDYVSYLAQNKTEAQKLQARRNIDALSIDETVSAQKSNINTRDIVLKSDIQDVVRNDGFEGNVEELENKIENVDNKVEVFKINVNNLLQGKVSKDGDKELSDENFTTQLKDKLVGLYTNQNIDLKINEINDRISGMATSKTFNTKQEMLDYIEANRNSILNGTNFYIIAQDVPDYWWDSTNKQAHILETEKVDLTNYVKKSDELKSLKYEGNTTLEEKLEQMVAIPTKNMVNIASTSVLESTTFDFENNEYKIKYTPQKIGRTNEDFLYLNNIHSFYLIVIDYNNDIYTAYAKKDESDNYFNANDLSKWVVKFIVDNNNTIQITYLKDEYNNESNFDFKNFTFIRYHASGVGYYKSYLNSSTKEWSTSTFSFYGYLLTNEEKDGFEESVFKITPNKNNENYISSYFYLFGGTSVDMSMVGTSHDNQINIGKNYINDVVATNYMTNSKINGYNLTFASIENSEIIDLNDSISSNQIRNSKIYGEEGDTYHNYFGYVSDSTINLDETEGCCFDYIYSSNFKNLDSSYDSVFREIKNCEIEARIEHSSIYYINTSKITKEVSDEYGRMIIASCNDLNVFDNTTSSTYDIQLYYTNYNNLKNCEDLTIYSCNNCDFEGVTSKTNNDSSYFANARHCVFKNLSGTIAEYNVEKVTFMYGNDLDGATIDKQGFVYKGKEIMQFDNGDTEEF